MSTRREPSTPPTIPGYTPSRVLGMGGFADVFLYEQLVPRRQVAVKVLLASHLSDDVRMRFRSEADLMAQLSHHPSIVTVYHADVAPDGRPFLVMEYCSRPGLGQRYRTERMGVAEVLRVGVRLASAVETAHRAGILHRDIKPANVLVTDFGWPALTDFGIAATTGLAAGAAMGMSIPWAPPEMLAERPWGDERADVWSLAATVYSLLARRSPFEVVGTQNTAADLIARIERIALPAVGRPDVPVALEALLQRAMDKNPEQRLPSALALARGLQQVEAELMLPLTPLDLPDDSFLPDVGDSDDDQDQATRLRPVQVVSPDAPPAAADRGPGAAGPGATGPAAGGSAPAGVGAAGAATGGGAVATATPPTPVIGPLGEHGVPEQWQQQADALAVGEAPGTSRTRRRLAAVAGGTVVVAGAAAAAALAFLPDDAPRAPESSPLWTATSAPVVAVPTPEDVVGTPGPDGVVFTWTNPDPQDGDRYTWAVVDPTGARAPEITSEPTATVTPDGPGEVCVEVSIVRADRRASTVPAVGCVDA